MGGRTSGGTGLCSLPHLACSHSRLQSLGSQDGQGQPAAPQLCWKLGVLIDQQPVPFWAGASGAPSAGLSYRKEDLLCAGHPPARARDPNTQTQSLD